ncbi:Spo0E family sporulation regulatory protein-aspartic acid phosphatase [Clostridium beijerinckii]|uniref:Spo0E family sporulation regulatory protein-aspartic acid phosphatase n=1 Tax=Clostridium beijerinckii TaxID=1520 RepID=A0AAW3W7W9_CLOBE|nr:Spo0E family sporulation regulatory protein-aspartic acid phosphatase [Clostridium beijerinckii]MBC2457528.1 Spo0E family sporulation regulatory protein-aspartic acid phosphatase [Clostridium beijerinckii]MBC2474647.1 Spo0E family sporulation regulatory protein-aspartic acid phosphatase [Clostridium beijerinckii]NOV62396.1 hypothetical protein [Clostridium beijerinckii]NOV68107.1 hypothetical protein [Clostridium beijerinckii]NOW30448.1 hypothetical protein [Clostridium beijerinckii]
MDYREINEKIDELREILNILMDGDYRENYENILELSIKLDNLIAECYKMKENQ